MGLKIPSPYDRHLRKPGKAASQCGVHLAHFLATVASWLIILQITH